MVIDFQVNIAITVRCKFFSCLCFKLVLIFFISGKQISVAKTMICSARVNYYVGDEILKTRLY